MAITSKAAALGFVPVLIVVIVFGVYLSQTTPPSSSTSTMTSITGSSTVTNTRVSHAALTADAANSMLGLKLVLSINSTVLNPGQTDALNIAIYNMLPTINNISISDKWPIGRLNVGPCGPLNFPFGMEVFQGYYSSSNISGAHPLSLWSPSPMYACPAILYVRYYLFQPMSDNGSIYVLSSNGTSQCCYERPGQPFPIIASLDVNSYWDSSNNQHNLQEGVYTVVGGDEWGELAILHFIVTVKAPASTSSATTLTHCIQTGPQQTVYVKVVSDNQQKQKPNFPPIQGANVSGTFALNCGGQVVNYPLHQQITPGNGTVLLQVVEGCDCSIGNYTVVIQTANGIYSVQLSPPILHLAQTVVATIGIPSASIVGMNITNSAVCVDSGHTITNATGFFC